MGFFFFFFVCLFSFLVSWPFVLFNGSVGLGSSFGGVFCLDYVAFPLVTLSLLIWMSLCYWYFDLSELTCILLLSSLLCSVFCYTCVHALWFWVFYELTILPLLFLLFTDSPYSERYIALWYFVGYVVLSSLPMLLCLLFFSDVYGCYDIRSWGEKSEDFSFVCVGVLLGVLFITKIPLFPFHSWLPVVHAESSSPVSICLSGYVMKLGLLGVFRFCSDLLGSFVLSANYVSVCLIASLFFFLVAIRELDVKRWLAFLSLGHISVAAGCLSLCGWEFHNLAFVYSLGHGLSAAAMFMVFWVVSRLVGSRNILLIKNVLWSGLAFRLTFCWVVGTVCCIPPTTQFFSELGLMVEFLWFSNHLLSVLLYLYIFWSGLIPVVLLAVMLTRHYDLNYSGNDFFIMLCSVILLVFWSFSLFFVC